MAMTVESYSLPSGASDVPDAIRNLYAIGSFPKEVRDWHLARLPRYQVPNVTYIFCPYCTKWKDRRSMQIDHIIPVRVYVRFKLYSEGIDDYNVAIRRTREVYNDVDNLLLSCMRCNTKKGDAMLSGDCYRNTIQGVQAAEGSNRDLSIRLETNRQTANEIGQLPANRHGINVREFVLNGASWSTSVMQTRSAPLSTDGYGKARKARRHTAMSSAPYETPASAFRKRLSTIHNAVVNTTTAGRPTWTVTQVQLEARQPTSNFTNEEMRLCFYCMGLFKKQAFQIDHIRPASGRLESIANYNDPTNLIPVCRTCNTGKGERPLSTVWLDEQVRRRHDEGLPGIEHATGVVIPGGYTDYLTYARQRRILLLGC